MWRYVHGWRRGATSRHARALASVSSGAETKGAIGAFALGLYVVVAGDRRRCTSTRKIDGHEKHETPESDEKHVGARAHVHAAPRAAGLAGRRCSFAVAKMLKERNEQAIEPMSENSSLEAG